VYDWEAVSSVENDTEAETMPYGSPTDAPKDEVRDTEFSLVMDTLLLLSQMNPDTCMLSVPKENVSVSVYAMVVLMSRLLTCFGVWRTIHHELVAATLLQWHILPLCRTLLRNFIITNFEDWCT